MAVHGSQISNRKAAKRSDLSPGYVGRVMNGKRMPKLDTAHRIAQAKRLTLDQLYDIIQGRRTKARDEVDTHSGINTARATRNKARKEGGLVEAPVVVDLDITPLQPTSDKDKFEMFGGEHSESYNRDHV